jgi:DNA-binding HxlR family transcriptional regulator
VARHSTAKKQETPAGGRTRHPQRLEAVEGNPALQLDRLIHERTRLAIVSALAASGVLTFSDLKALLQLTDGNLSIHCRRLEEAGYIVCEKTFEKRVPKTSYSLSPSGQRALKRYLNHMEALIESAREHSR